MRDPNSHKGENGKVAVIGGSTFQHGAPIMSALAAERSGVDLVYLALPSHHAEVARMASLNVQVHPFAGEEFSERDLSMVVEMLATVDCAVIGPGMGRDPKTIAAIKSLVESAPCPLVLDATALQPWTLMAVSGRSAVVTPHLGELERMGVSPAEIIQSASAYGAVLHLKGQVDCIAAPDVQMMQEVSGGNAGLTVGGTGDALAGLIAGLRAQGVEPLQACILSSQVIKKAGEELSKDHGFAYRAVDVIEQIPHLLQAIHADASV